MMAANVNREANLRGGRSRPEASETFSDVF